MAQKSNRHILRKSQVEESKGRAMSELSFGNWDMTIPNGECLRKSRNSATESAKRWAGGEDDRKGNNRQ